MASGKHLELHIKEKCQTASGGSYLVIYDALVTLLSSTRSVEVEIIRTEPRDCAPRLIMDARGAIRLGVTRSLATSELGAKILVQRIVLHDADFSPQKCAELTTIELNRILGIV